jgi:hypothetical protein
MGHVVNKYIKKKNAPGDLNMTQSMQGGEHYVFEDRGLGIYGEYICTTEKGTTQLNNKKNCYYFKSFSENREKEKHI